jgi:3-phenylpropionate/cinnamic acid dioxygenase small subunit
MSDDATEIFNLLYVYAERIDAGDFVGASALFAHADIAIRNTVAHGSQPILEFFTTHMRVHADGTPRCRHVTSNPILVFSEDRTSATVRSYYAVLQATDVVPLQVIMAGRYEDTFEKAAGMWRFSRRMFGPANLIGDVGDYLRR